MKRYKLGKAFLIIGILCVLGAGGLVIKNYLEDQRAAALSNALYQKLTNIIMNRSEDELQSDGNGEVMICLEDQEYLGMLQIPSLELFLPVAGKLTDSGLKESPCRYTGRIDHNLVIGAHNYQRHFGTLSSLSYGAEVVLVDALGTSHYYEVQEMTTVQPTQVKNVVASDYELTLFTCNYGGSTRLIVRCAKVEKK